MHRDFFRQIEDNIIALTQNFITSSRINESISTIFATANKCLLTQNKLNFMTKNCFCVDNK